MLEANPEVPGLFDTPAGGGRFRSKKEKPTGAAAFEKSMEETNAKGIVVSKDNCTPVSPSGNTVSKKLDLFGFKSALTPSLFAESNEWFDKATDPNRGVEKFC